MKNEAAIITMSIMAFMALAPLNMWLSASSRWMGPHYLWKGSCLALAMLYMISFIVLGYLKFTGEVMPFCFYDNFFYGAFYFFLFLYSFLAMELPHIPISKSYARNWYHSKFVCCCIWLTETEALVQFLLHHSQIWYELEIDASARPFIRTLLALGIARFMVVSVLIYFALNKLNRVILHKSYHGDIFGSFFTFFSDFAILQLYTYTIYIYDFSLPLVLFISCISYIYYKYARP